MYNGIGLTTVRGSATSGHVSKNLSYLRPEFFRNKLDSNLSGGRHGDAQRSKTGAGFKVNKDVLEHNKKHALEAEVFEFEESLRDSGKYSEETIADKTAEFRIQQQRKESYGSVSRDTSKHPGHATDTHEISARKNEENRKLRSAFGIRDDFVSGASFDPVAQEQRRKEREQERATRYEKNKLDRERRVLEQEERRVKREADQASRQAARVDEGERPSRDDSRDRRDRVRRNRSNSRDAERRGRDRRDSSRGRDGGRSSRWNGNRRGASRSRSRSRGGDSRRGERTAAVDRKLEEGVAVSVTALASVEVDKVEVGSTISKSGRICRGRSPSRSPPGLRRKRSHSSGSDSDASKSRSRSRSSSSGTSSSSSSASRRRGKARARRTSRSPRRSHSRGRSANKRTRRSRSRS